MQYKGIPFTWLLDSVAATEHQMWPRTYKQNLFVPGQNFALALKHSLLKQTNNHFFPSPPFFFFFF